MKDPIYLFFGSYTLFVLFQYMYSVFMVYVVPFIVVVCSFIIPPNCKEVNVCLCKKTILHQMPTSNRSNYTNTNATAANNQKDQEDSIGREQAEQLDYYTLDDQPSDELKYAYLIGKLKRTPRTGWVRRNVPRYESVADHSWRVAALTLMLHQDHTVNPTRCMELALVHDMAECIVGDIAPDDNVSKQDKAKLEEQAIHQIANLLGPSRKEYLLQLFQEYEERSSNEAIVVKDLDLLDMILQADEYEEIFENTVDLSEFFESTPVSRFRTQTVQALAQQVHERRKRRQGRTKAVARVGAMEQLSPSDRAFVTEHAKASKLNQDEISQVILALRSSEEHRGM